jgi:hypothetical protein
MLVLLLLQHSQEPILSTHYTLFYRHVIDERKSFITLAICYTTFFLVIDGRTKNVKSFLPSIFCHPIKYLQARLTIYQSGAPYTNLKTYGLAYFGLTRKKSQNIDTWQG